MVAFARSQGARSASESPVLCCFLHTCHLAHHRHLTPLCPAPPSGSAHPDRVTQATVNYALCWENLKQRGDDVSATGVSRQHCKLDPPSWVSPFTSQLCPSSDSGSHANTSPPPSRCHFSVDPLPQPLALGFWSRWPTAGGRAEAVFLSPPLCSGTSLSPFSLCRPILGSA